MRWIGRIVAALLLCATAASAQAPTRVALVIANANYGAYRQLPNAAVDAGLVTASLRRAGFQVEQASDLGIAQFRTALGRFQARANGAEVALVYFAGHGMEAGGKNWLIPTDAQLATDAELDFQAIEANLVIRAAAGAQARIVVLDACRDNPFAIRMRSTGMYPVTRAAGGGLGALNVQNARGTLLMYSAASGETASDGTPGQGSPFARAFARHMPEPGVELLLAVRRIADTVFTETNATQLPFTTTSLSGTEIYLVPRAPGAVDPELERLRRELERFRAGAGTTPSPSSSMPVVTAPRPNAGEVARAPGAPFRDCAECPEMVWLPAGAYQRGDAASDQSDEKPVRTVSIRAFAAGRYEVTRGEYAAFVAASGRPAPAAPSFRQDDRHPVVNVSWQDAQQYVRWLSQRTQKDYRLLTEAEWEYAARAGASTRYAFGDSINPQQANYADSGLNGTERVGSYRANAFGLHDAHGNVWEWVEDCYAETYAAAPTDGSAYDMTSCTFRVIRGGGWFNTSAFLRSADRIRYAPTNRGSNLGFRVARTP